MPPGAVVALSLGERTFAKRLNCDLAQPRASASASCYLRDERFTAPIYNPRMPDSEPPQPNAISDSLYREMRGRVREIFDYALAESGLAKPTHRDRRTKG